MQKRGQTSWFTGSRRTFAFDPCFLDSLQMAKAPQSVTGRRREWQLLSGAPPAAVVSVAVFGVVLSVRSCPERSCPARRVRPSLHLSGFTRRPRKSTRPDAGRAAQSTTKLDLHARPGLNASTVCVFSFEQSAYPTQIAEDRKDAHSTQLTPEERAALNCKAFVINERPLSIPRHL